MGRETKQGRRLRGMLLQGPLLGTINVIFVAHGKIGSHPSRVMFVARPPTKDPNSKSKKARVEI